MCGTPEEFLAAFRRYVDRHGLFVPTATPAPALHHGRFAITLSDGRVMVEGEAEIASSSPRPSALYGRTGMTLHFTSVDDASRAALSALEKAKLSIKVTSHAATLEARPSRLTAPVEHPPVKVAGGSLDKTLVMAECVMVGDAASLTPGRAGKSAAAAAGKTGARFVIPSIQPTGSAPATSISGKQAASSATPTVTGPPVTTSMRNAAIDDGPSEATEVGPIVEEALIQPSGPTLTTTVPPELASSPLPPEALAAAVMAGGRPPEADIETTLGGPPPMPPSVPSPITRQPSSPVTGAATVAAAAAGQAAPIAPSPSAPSAGVPVAPVVPVMRTPLGPATSRPEPPTRAVTAPIAGLVPSRAPSSLPTSVPAIAPLRAPTPRAESEAAAAQSGPVKRPSSHAIPSVANGPSKRPSSQVIPTSLGMAAAPQASASAVASGPISAPPLRPSSTALGAAPMAQASSAVSGPAIRPSAQALRNGAAPAGAVVSHSGGHSGGHSGPVSRPSGSAIAPLTAAPAASQPSPVPKMTPPVPSAPLVAPRAESATAERNGDDRKSSSGIRRTAIGIAATYVEPAQAVAPVAPLAAASPAAALAAHSAAPIAPLSVEDSMGVPEAVHDSMFEIPDREPGPEAVPEPSDLRATRKEGLPRSPVRHPTPATSAASRASLDSAFDDSDRAANAVQERLDGLIEAALDSSSSGRLDRSSRNSRSSLPSAIAPSPSGPLKAPSRATTAQMPPVPTRPSAPPARFGKSSESVAAAPQRLDGEGSGELAADSGAAPRVGPTPPSQPTVPIRPPSTAPGSGPVAAPRGTAAALAAQQAAPSSVDDAWATVPTTAPPHMALESLRSAPAPSAAAPAAVEPAPPQRNIHDSDTESLDTDDPDDPVFGAAIAPPAARPTFHFSDAASVSEPLDAVSPARPPVAIETPAAEPGAAADAGVDVLLDDDEPASADADSPEPVSAARPASEPSLEPTSEPAPKAAPPEPKPRARRGGGEGAVPADAKVEIDPALYAESAIDQSFEANFVLPGSEAPPPAWQQQPWDPASAGIPSAPSPEQQQAYGYGAPPQESPYPPGYDMAYPQSYHTGDETALVMAPDVGRRRTWVIVGSAIFVLLAGFAAYLLLDRAKKHGAPGAGHPAAVSPQTSDAAETKPDEKAEPASAKPDELSGSAPDEKTDEKSDTKTDAKAVPAKVDDKADTKASAAEAKSKVEMIDVEISAPAGTQIKVDGKPLPRGAKRASLPSGVPVEIEISKGARSSSKTITPDKGTKKVTMTLPKNKGKAPRKAQPPSGNSLNDL